MTIKKPQLRGFLTFPKFSENIGWYVYAFAAFEFEGNLIESNEGNLEWINDEKLLELNLWEGDKIFLKWPKQESIFSGKFIYKNGKLIKHQVSFYS